jgi:hypothetical protein
MQIQEVEQLVSQAAEYAGSATTLFGEASGGDAALVSSQIAIAKALVAIAVVMVKEFAIRTESCNDDDDDKPYYPMDRQG